MSRTTQRCDGFDGAAALTRSLLGWGVIAGVFYLVVGTALALTREGFDITRYPLSLLMLGEFGWIQRLNILLTGLMTIAAALGFTRAMRGSNAAIWAGVLIGGFGTCLIASGVFPPDPMPGFPSGAAPSGGSASGVLHFAFGVTGFLLLAAAAFVVATWCARRRETSLAVYSRISGVIIIVGFASGAVLPTQQLGTLSLWIVVLAIWAWLATASVHLYRTVPHPDAATTLDP